MFFHIFVSIKKRHTICKSEVLGWCSVLDKQLSFSMYFDFDIEIPWKDHGMLHSGSWFRPWDWFTLYQKDMWTRPHFDAGIFPFKASGLCPLVATLQVQYCTGRIRFAGLSGFEQPNLTLNLVLLCTERVTRYRYCLRCFLTWTILWFCNFAVY